ncbi:hypothetical protein Tco_0305518 [Tanacetum coccineum]
MDDMIKEKLGLKQQIESLEQNLSNQIKEKESSLQTFTVFKNESKEKESKYIDKEIDLEKKIKELDNIVYKVGQFAQTVHIVISDNHVASHVFDDEATLILEELNRLSEDFGKHFVPQQELSDEQAFWLQTSHPNTNQSASSPVKIEAPRELPKITPDALTKGEWGFEHTKVVFLKEIIPFLKTLKDIFNVFDKDLLNELQAKDTTICKFKEHINTMRENDKEEKVKHEMDEIETINIELEHSVAKLLSENERLHKEVEHLKKIYKDQFDSIKETCALSKEHDDSLIAQLNNKSMENANFKFQIQDKESLIYVRDMCPNAIKLSEKKVVITPMNKVKKVRFSEPLTSSSNIKQVESPKTYDSNTPVLSSTGLKCSTSTCRSQPTDNKKNDRILQKPSCNRKNKVEAQPRKVNKKNRVKEPICDDNVKQTMLNSNSQLICVKCKQCMFDANHDVCFMDFVNDV